MSQDVYDVKVLRLTVHRIATNAKIAKISQFMQMCRHHVLHQTCAAHNKRYLRLGE